MEVREHFLDGDRLFVRSWGDGKGRANVVICHGYAEHSGRYHHVAEALVAAGFDVYAPDHRGHGRSGGAVRGDIESWEGVVADLDLVLDEVVSAGDRPTFLVGHSLGGAIAATYALDRQSRLAGLALSGPALSVPAEMLAMSQLPEIPIIDVAGAVSSDPAVVEDYRADPLNYLGAMPRNLLLLLHDVDKLAQRLSELGLPVLVMHGSADVLVPVQALKVVVDRVDSADLSARVWPGMFHEIFNEPARDRVIAELTRWVAERA